MKLNYPGWFDPYGEQSGYYDATGWFYWNCIGNGPDGFVVYVFRTKDGNTERVPYAPLLHHGLLTQGDRGLILTGFHQWSSKVPKEFHAIDIQGFVPWDKYTAERLPITIVTPVNGVDDVARGMVTDARKVADGANGKVNALTKQVEDHLKNHPAAQVVNNGLTQDQVAAIAWQKANDALYNAVVNADENGYFAQGVKKFAPKPTATTPATVDMAAIEKLVLEKINNAKIVAN